MVVKRLDADDRSAAFLEDAVDLTRDLAAEVVLTVGADAGQQDDCRSGPKRGAGKREFRN